MTYFSINELNFTRVNAGRAVGQTGKTRKRRNGDHGAALLVLAAQWQPGQTQR